MIEYTSENTVLITHRYNKAYCMDGVGCMLALGWYLNTPPSELDIITVAYGSKEYTDIVNGHKDNLLIGKNVIMADFSFDRETIERMHDISESFVVIDHHETAEKHLSGLPYATFDMSKSGAVLLWNYLFPSNLPPLVLQYIQDRDLWKFELLNSELVSNILYISMLEDTNYTLVDDLYNKGIEYDPEKDIKYEDRIINDVKHTTIDTLSKIITHTCDLDGIEVPMIYSNLYPSEIGSKLSTFEYPVVGIYNINEGVLKVSLRSSAKNALYRNVAEIAEKFGGGGHKHAAGFENKITDEFLHKFYISKKL